MAHFEDFVYSVGPVFFALLYRGERGNPTRKDNGAHNVSHELETLRFVLLLMPLFVSVPKLHSISGEA